ncbi:DUF2917 domain-containing protein [Ramlibacter alkalitolerans]|uniref:DUF2917 domain-containing protein n=1 Tax=Ramlibacter alkalitolerans TaxID=2039631 RepID=A0ABS1JRG3_9BURK|nr:DUF2917 domain-containing protein [Ramlibacter alkalitolerans]MBL0426864.1 DUF2917 domain-containing protein [Ramlibacter alkalitolerans]
MTKEDSLQFVQERLRHNHSPLARELRLLSPPRVKRRFAIEMEQGEARRFDPVDDTVMIGCASGSVWITHDGDPKDIILGANESYHAEREDAMHVFAMQRCVLEIEFEDDVLARH